LESLKGSLERIILSSVNFDGHRAIVIADSNTQLWTREKRRIDLPDNLAQQLRELNLPRGTVLDGEIWNPAKRGGWKQTRDASCRLTLWDAIQTGTTNLSQQPIEKRREALHALMRPECPHIRAVEVQEATLENCQLAYLQATQMRESMESRSGFIHGVVLKRNGSPRRDHACRSTEHPDWLKIVFDGLSGWAPR
jgi:ATP-dependent DNA ligase